MKVVVKDFVAFTRGMSLYREAHEGNLDQVRHLLRQGANVNAKNEYGNAVLSAACYKGFIQVVGALLSHVDVDVNIKDNCGNTALIWASAYGHVDVVRVLLKHGGVEVNIRNDDGNTALIYASSYGYFEVVGALLELTRVDVNIKNNNGKTALDVARDREYDDVVRILEERIRMERKKRNAEEEQRQKDAESKHAMEDIRRRQELNKRTAAGSGAVQRVEFERDRGKLLKVMNTPSAKPVELSVEFIKRCIKKDHDGKQIELGKGAYGDVFLAEDSRLPKKFAVKMISPTHCDRETIKEIRKTFLTELSTLKRFRHPNIIVLYGFSLNANSTQQCLVYEYAANGSLAGFLTDDGNRARLSAGNRLSIMFQLTRAVHFLHTGGCKVAGEGWKVFHRDITSANICLADDFSPRLIDCGLAKLVPDDNSNGPVALRTTGGLVWGTPGYMCPDYLEKKCRGLPCPYIAAYDVYSIGVVLVEVILGRLNARPSTQNGTRFLDVFEMYVQDERHRPIIDGWKKLKHDAGPTKDWNPNALELVCKAAIACMAPFPEERLNTKDLLDELRDAILVNANAGIQHPEAANAVDSDPCCVICHNYSADIQCTEGHALCTTCIVDKLGDDSGCQLLCLIKGCSSPPFQDEDLYGRIPFESYKRYVEELTERRTGTNVSSEL